MHEFLRRKLEMYLTDGDMKLKYRGLLDRELVSKVTCVSVPWVT